MGKKIAAWLGNRKNFSVESWGDLWGALYIIPKDLVPSVDDEQPLRIFHSQSDMFQVTRIW